MKEAVDALSKDHEIAMLHFSEIYPFPSAEQVAYLKILGEATNNYLLLKTTPPASLHD